MLVLFHTNIVIRIRIQYKNILFFSFKTYKYDEKFFLQNIVITFQFNYIGCAGKLSIASCNLPLSP